MEKSYVGQDEIVEERKKRRRSSNSSDGSDNSSSSSHEKRFYASFNIYLNSDSRKTSIVIGDEDLDQLGDFTGSGEVVRIEKTEEVSDDDVSDEDEKTLSVSNENILDPLDKEKLEDTDNDEDVEIRIIEESADIRVNTSRNLSLPERISRSVDRHDRHRGDSGFERTQSVDRVYRRRETSPVFYLDPSDWIPSPRNSPMLRDREGVSPLPHKDKIPNPIKLLESMGCGLDVLSESEENLSNEVEALTSTHPQSDPTGLRTELDQCDRLDIPDMESPGAVRSRSTTPVTGLGRAMLERHRKTPIPVLCSRAVWMAEHVASSPIPVSMSTHRRSDPTPFILDGLSLHSGRVLSSRMASSTRSLSTLGRCGLSQEDVRGSVGNIQHLGEFISNI